MVFNIIYHVLFPLLLKKPRHKLPKKKPRTLKKNQLDELKHEIEMVVFLSCCFVFLIHKIRKFVNTVISL